FRKEHVKYNREVGLRLVASVALLGGAVAVAIIAPQKAFAFVPAVLGGLAALDLRDSYRKSRWAKGQMDHAKLYAANPNVLDNAQLDGKMAEHAEVMVASITAAHPQLSGVLDDLAQKRQQGALNPRSYLNELYGVVTRHWGVR